MKKNNLKLSLVIVTIMAIAVGGVGLVLAEADDDTNETSVYPCDGLGPFGLYEDKGFWSQLTEEQVEELVNEIQTLRESGATTDEIREKIASMLEDWGLEEPLWAGPHYGGFPGKMHHWRYNDEANQGQGYMGRGMRQWRNGFRGNGLCNRSSGG